MNVQFTNESEAKILIVDDKPENLSLLTGMLKGKGYIIRQLRNGKRVMPSVLSDAPDLILLDIMMPEPDGYKVCELLKAEEKARGIPVIYMRRSIRSERFLSAESITSPNRFRRKKCWLVSKHI